MRSFLGVIVLMIVGIVAVGFYRGWFQMSSSRDSMEQKVNTTFTVDEQKFHEDKANLEGFVERAKDEPGATGAVAE